jgi:hypothetical protein
MNEFFVGLFFYLLIGLFFSMIYNYETNNDNLIISASYAILWIFIVMFKLLPKGIKRLYLRFVKDFKQLKNKNNINKNNTQDLFTNSAISKQLRSPTELNLYE